MATFLTYDLGTTLYKVALFDEQGKLIHVERATPPIEHPHPNWSEVRPEDFRRVLQQATLKLKACVGEKWDDLHAVTFATQANSFICLDASHRPTTNLILWTDQRASDLAPELQTISQLPDFRHSTGMPRFSPLLGLSKLLHLRRRQPELLADAKRLFFLSDYFTLLLTGNTITEAGVAALSGALDIHTLRWKADVLDRAGIGEIQMPEITRAGTIAVALNRAVADDFGLPINCCLVVGCLDQYAGAIGTGTVEPGRLCETTGTVLAAVRCVDRLGDELAAEVFQGPGFDAERFFQMSFSSTSANLLEWYRNHLPGHPSFDELTLAAFEATPADDLVIEPYDDRGSIEASFRNVTSHHTRGQVVRAVMDRVAQQLKAQVEQLAAAAPPAEIRCAGGAARNDLWLQIKADALGIAMVALTCEEPTSLGAAMLAARALGVGSLPELSQKWIHTRARFEPRAR